MQVYTVTATFADYNQKHFCGVEYEEQVMGIFSTKEKAMKSLRKYCLDYNWEIYSLRVSKVTVDKGDAFENPKVIFDERVEELMTEAECEEYGVF